jgi:hypothetical protein
VNIGGCILSTRLRPEPRDVPSAPHYPPGVFGRKRLGQSGGQSAKAAVLGAWVQRTAVFDLRNLLRHESVKSGLAAKANRERIQSAQQS